jgi:hypothetical protein
LCLVHARSAHHSQSASKQKACHDGHPSTQTCATAAGATSADSREVFQAELSHIQHLLKEVRVAASVAEQYAAPPHELDDIRSRGHEVKAVGNWCHQEGVMVCLASLSFS